MSALETAGLPLSNAPLDHDSPRDAATLVIVSLAEGEPQVLMGRRRADQIFLPNKYVFPGGRVDAADHTLANARELEDHESGKLQLAMQGVPSPARARALALAAIRETFEETGILIGSPFAQADSSIPAPWRPFIAHGFVPDLSRLTYFARAITPPGRTRRYDTRFFAVEAEAIAHRVDITDGELSNIGWYPLEVARTLDLPGITRVIVEDLADRLKLGLQGPPTAPIPFYFHHENAFKRVQLSLAKAQTYDEIVIGP